MYLGNDRWTKDSIYQVALHDATLDVKQYPLSLFDQIVPVDIQFKYSLKGKACNSKPNSVAKPRLDPAVENTIVGQFIYFTIIFQLKNG